MLTPEVQINVYARSRSLEARALAIDTGIRQLKSSCLDVSGLAVPQIVSQVSELKWQLGQAAELISQIGDSFGVKSGSEPSSAARGSDSDAPPVEEPGIRGTTDVFPVPDLFSMLGQLEKTGTLILRSATAMFAFEFQRGKIVHALTNAEENDLRLGTILIAQNKLTSEQLDEHLTACTETNELLGTHLVQTSTVSDTDLRAALDAQVRKIFELAFELRGSRFSFVEGSISRIAQRAAINTTELLLDAARQSDTAKRTSSTSETRGALDTILGD